MLSATQNRGCTFPFVRRGLFVVVCAISCGARTQLDEPRDATTQPDGPDFVWYKLDETSGTTAHDSSSNHYDVALSGVTWNDGAIFDGTVCGSVDVGPAFRDPPITITAWLTVASRADETSNAYFFMPFPPNALSGDTPGAGGYGLGADVWTDGVGGAVVTIESGVGSSSGFHAIEAPLSVGAQSFVAVVVATASAATVYFDGAELAQTTANDPPSANPARLHLGCTNDDAGYGSRRFFRGRMRDVRVYKRALGASEVAVLHVAGPV